MNRDWTNLSQSLGKDFNETVKEKTKYMHED